MRVVASRVIRVGGRTSAPVGIARAPLETREGLVLVLTSDDGLEGSGEASPLPGYSPETIDEAAAALDGIHRSLAPLDEEPGAHRRVGPTHPERGAQRRVEGLETLTSPLASPLLAEVPSARFAVETALLDLLGRRSGVPARRLLRATSPAPIPRSVLMPPPCDPRSMTAARDAVDRGIGTLKWKLGARPFDEELAALTRLRGALGEAIAIRLDANGGLGLGVDARLRALAAVRPAFVEEPVSGAALVALLAAGAAAVPVAADESLADPAIADVLLAQPGLGAVVVKPALLGFLRAREIAIAASRRGIPVVVTHLFDGPIALAACAELALSLPSPAACGLDLHPGLVAYPPLAVPHFHDPAFVVPVEGTGLCLAPHTEALAWRT